MNREKPEVTSKSGSKHQLNVFYKSMISNSAKLQSVISYRVTKPHTKMLVRFATTSL
jgi:hypothetical protein